jgi:hypothetical protein
MYSHEIPHSSSRPFHFAFLNADAPPMLHEGPANLETFSDDEDAEVSSLAHQAEQPVPALPPMLPAPQPCLATREPKDGAEVTDFIDPEIDTASSIYHGELAWCGLPRKGSKARPLAHGKGILTLSNGSKYEGSFQRGQRHGYGRWATDDGDVYEGDWREDEVTGAGTLNFGAGGSYKGEWVHGYPNGQGTKEECDGTKYVGQFHNDRRHGWGKLYDPHGALVREGDWKDGREYNPPPKPASKKREYKFVDRVRPKARTPSRAHMSFLGAHTPAE